MLFFCRQTGHRVPELAATASEVNVNIASCLLEDEDSGPDHELSPRERLEHDKSIQMDLQWCGRRRLIVEVNLWLLPY